jgi:ankyrin repeat protein
MTTFDEADRMIKKGNIIALRDALNNGLNANTENRYGWSLLMSAANRCDVRIGELLISQGADVNHITKTKPPSLSGSPLQLAILRGHVPFIQLLLSHGAKTDHMPPLAEWIKYSGLPQKKIDEMLNIFKQ